jgi:tetratricopeptide (TPR) repeat protein
MSQTPYAVDRLDEIETFSSPENPDWRRVRSHFGIEAFGINAWTATAAGQLLIGEHDEVGTGAGRHEELYLITSGRARFTMDGEEIDAPAGTLVFVRDPASKRGAVAEEEGTTVLVVGGKPGEAFAVSPWERNSEVLRFWETREWDKAIEELSRLHEQEPESAGVLYNLACAESQAGRTDDALAHLAQAIELHGDFAAAAQDDSDLAPVRDDPRFP